MATNFFFNNFKSYQEQQLIENLIIEAIRIYGEDMLYIPRKINNYDSVYGADDQSSYDIAIPIELYIKSIDGFSGDGNFMSKFGVEIRDQVVFSVAQRRFKDDVASVTSQLRPNEGDLIYFPLNNKCFQIKNVSKFEMFYQLGALQTWELTCELFEYSNEKFNTGVPQIDSLQLKLSTNVLDYLILTEEDAIPIVTEDGNYNLVNEALTLSEIVKGSNNEDIQLESDLFIDFSAIDPFTEGNI
jgi:hypothetical protein